MPKKLKRTTQCLKCPWRKDVNPFEIPDGYSIERHRALKDTIATPGDLSNAFSDEPMRVMACHETQDAHCVGWLVNQLGDGNNLGLRIVMRGCPNLHRLRTIGEQHATFDETVPS